MRHVSQKTIEQFINDSLDESQLKQLLDHLEVCDSCYNETEVYYMITTGLLNQDENRAESADLRAGFRDFVESKKNAVKKEERKRDRISYILTALFIAFLVLLYHWVV